MSRYSPSFEYGDAVAVVVDDSIRFGVVTTILHRVDASGEATEWEVEYYVLGGAWETYVITDSTEIADCPSTREAYSEFDELVQTSDARKSVLKRSREMKAPLQPIAVLPDVTSSPKPTS